MEFETVVLDAEEASVGYSKGEDVSKICDNFFATKTELESALSAYWESFDEISRKGPCGVSPKARTQLDKLADAAEKAAAQYSTHKALMEAKFNELISYCRDRLGEFTDLFRDSCKEDKLKGVTSLIAVAVQTKERGELVSAVELAHQAHALINHILAEITYTWLGGHQERIARLSASQ